ncbi:MAG: hypothetical protein MJ071_03030 [Oscillospiraceae bacterium]|nr:hypothetical protein [Oscillospiraceae bacterium]
MKFFRSWEATGRGINPNAPKKTPFFRFWDVMWHNLGKLVTLNTIYTLLHAPLLLSLIIYIDTNNKFTNLMVLLLLVIQFILEGPIMTGCTRVLRLIVLDKAFFLWEEFKKGFTSNFGSGLLYWTIDAFVIASAVAGYYVYPKIALESGNNAIYIPYGISLAVSLILLFMNYYIMPLQAATTLNKSSVLKNSFMLVGLSLKQCVITTLGAAAMLGLMALLIMLSSYFMFLLPFFPAAFIGYLVLFVNYPVIQRYVINPYYEAKGEANPEDEPVVSEEDRVFTDRGGYEEPKEQKSSKKGKTIS